MLTLVGHTIQTRHLLRTTLKLQTPMAQNGEVDSLCLSPTRSLLRGSYHSRLAGRIQVVSISILTPSGLHVYTHALPPTPALVGEHVSRREDASVPGFIRNNSEPSFWRPTLNSSMKLIDAASKKMFLVKELINRVEQSPFLKVNKRVLR